MKITIFALHLATGGVEKYIATLANMLCEEHDVSIISTYQMQPEPAFAIDKRVHITYLLHKTPNKDDFRQALKSFDFIRLCKEAYRAMLILYQRKACNKRAIKDCQADVILSTRIFHNKLIGKYASVECVKITGEHNHPHGNMKYIEKVVSSCKGFQYFLPISKELTEFYKEPMRQIGVESIYIPFCVDSYERKQSIDLRSMHLINVGRFSAEKGIVDLIRVFHLVHKQLPSTHLDLVGDGAQRPIIEEEIAKYNLQNDVTLHGMLEKEEVYALYERSACYVMTSHTESFGLVLLEAMSCGLGAFAFASAEGACEIITDKQDGWIIENRDISKMAEAMVLYLHDDMQRERVYKAALAKAQMYQYAHTKENWLNLMHRIQRKESDS